MNQTLFNAIHIRDTVVIYNYNNENSTYIAYTFKKNID